jgi:hypothetical protein
MSFRKTKLIQERNVLLEKKYILEQVNEPTTGTTTSTQTPNPSEKIDKDLYKNLALCSSVKNPPNPEKIQTEFGVVLKQPGGKTPYCKMEK